MPTRCAGMRCLLRHALSAFSTSPSAALRLMEAHASPIAARWSAFAIVLVAHAALVSALLSLPTKRAAFRETDPITVRLIAPPAVESEPKPVVRPNPGTEARRTSESNTDEAARETTRTDCSCAHRQGRARSPLGRSCAAQQRRDSIAHRVGPFTRVGARSGRTTGTFANATRPRAPACDVRSAAAARAAEFHRCVSDESGTRVSRAFPSHG
jgi:hypothetical protein